MVLGLGLKLERAYSQVVTSGLERKRKSFAASELRAVSESKLNGCRMRFSVEIGWRCAGLGRITETGWVGYTGASGG